MTDCAAGEISEACSPKVKMSLTIFLPVLGVLLQNLWRATFTNGKHHLALLVRSLLELQKFPV